MSTTSPKTPSRISKPGCRGLPSRTLVPLRRPGIRHPRFAVVALHHPRGDLPRLRLCQGRRAGQQRGDANLDHIFARSAALTPLRSTSGVRLSMTMVLPLPLGPEMATSCAPAARRSRSCVNSERPRPSQIPRKPGALHRQERSATASRLADRRRLRGGSCGGGRGGASPGQHEPAGRRPDRCAVGQCAAILECRCCWPAA